MYACVFISKIKTSLNYSTIHHIKINENTEDAYCMINKTTNEEKGHKVTQ